MPPQDTNTTNNQVPPQGQPSSAQASANTTSFDSLHKNPKFMVTVKTLVIYGMVINLANALVGMLMTSFSISSRFIPFSIIGLIFALILGAIGSAVGAVVFYYLYDPFHKWVKSVPFLAKHIHNMFTLFWKPFIVFTIISALFGLVGILHFGAAVTAIAGGAGVIGFGALFIGWIISLIVSVGVYYWYAKAVSAKLEQYYPW